MTAEGGVCTRERSVHALEAGAASAARLPLEKWRDVIDCYSLQQRVSAVRWYTAPPQLRDITDQGRLSSALRQQRMLVPPRGEREAACGGRILSRRMQLSSSARRTSAPSDVSCFHEEADAA